MCLIRINDDEKTFLIDLHNYAVIAKRLGELNSIFIKCENGSARNQKRSTYMCSKTLDAK